MGAPVVHSRYGRPPLCYNALQVYRDRNAPPWRSPPPGKPHNSRPALYNALCSHKCAHRWRYIM